MASQGVMVIFQFLKEIVMELGNPIVNLPLSEPYAELGSCGCGCSDGAGAGGGQGNQAPGSQLADSVA